MVADAWQTKSRDKVQELWQYVKELELKYETHDTCEAAQQNRAFIAATEQLVTALSWWICSNTTYNQELIPFDKDEMVRRLDMVVRTLRHTR